MVEGRARIGLSRPDLMAMRRADSLRGMISSDENHLSEVTAAKWLEENGEAILSSNAWIEAHGLPLRGCRLF